MHSVLPCAGAPSCADDTDGGLGINVRRVGFNRAGNQGKWVTYAPQFFENRRLLSLEHARPHKVPELEFLWLYPFIRICKTMCGSLGGDGQSSWEAELGLREEEVEGFA